MRNAVNIFRFCQIDTTYTACLQYYIRDYKVIQLFLNYVTNLVEVGFLQPYDIFVGNNAKIHAHGDCKELADALWQSQKILWLPIPPYTPELNPTELVFHTLVERGKVTGPRILQQDNQDIVDVASSVLDGITRDEVVSFYNKCGYHGY